MTKKYKSSLLALTFILAAHLLQAQNFVVGNGGAIIRTNNKAKNWKVQATNTTQNFFGVGNNKDTVFAVGENSRVFYSTNGANTAPNLIYGAGANNHDWSEVGIFTRKRIIIHPRAFRGTATENISTTDGGATWMGDVNGGNVYGLQVMDTLNAFRINGNVVQRTTNTGLTWTNIFVPPGLRGIAAYGDSMVMAVGTTGSFFKSTNGGSTWARQSLNTNQTLNRVAVSQNGKIWIVVGGGGVARRSIDTGRTWQNITIHPSGGGNNDVYFLDTANVLAVSDNVNGELSMYNSTNGGATWNRFSNSNLPNSNNNSGPLLAISFKNRNLGFVSGAGDRARMYRTTDGGGSWTQIDLTGAEANRNVTSIVPFSADTICIGYNGAYGAASIWRTTDAGASWVEYNFPPNSNLDRLQRSRALMVSNTEAILVCMNGIALRTTDQGLSWNPLTLDANGSFLRDIIPGWIVGDNAKMYKFSSLASATPVFPLGYDLGTLRDFHAVDFDTFYVAGLGGSILKSTNKGLSWRYVGNSSINTNLTAISFSNARNGVAVGFNGLLMHTQNGGDSWTVSNPVTTNLNDVGFSNDSVGVIVGNAGVILRTINGGRSWERQYSSMNLDLTKLSFKDNSEEPLNLPLITLRADSVASYQNAITSLPIRVKDFRKMSGLQATLAWDTAQLRLSGIGALSLAGLTRASFDSTQKLNGQLAFTWTGSRTNPLTLADSAIIFRLNFLLKGAPGSVAQVNFNSNRRVLGGLDSAGWTRDFNLVAGKLQIITAPTIATTDLADTQYCAGSNVKVSFSVNGGNFIQPNTFTAQISDSTGSFANPINIGTKSALGSDTVIATIPASAIPTRGYKIRIIASNPSQLGVATTTSFRVAPIPARPTLSATGNQVICPGDSLTLTAPAGFAGYVWNNNATTQSITVRVAGQFNVRVVNAQGCISTASVNTNTSIGNRPSTPSISVQGNRTTLCQGDSVQLTSSAATVYLWSTGATTRNIFVKDAGSYTVQIRTSPTGCLSLNSVASTITVNPKPATPNINQIGQDSLQSTVSGTTYLWQRNGSPVSGSNAQKIRAVQGGSYTVSVVIAGCTSAISTPLIISSLGQSLAINELNVWPNPVSEQLMVDISEFKDLDRLMVVDLLGRPVQETRNLNEGKLSISLQNISNGTYMLQAFDKQGLVGLKRFQKQ